MRRALCTLAAVLGIALPSGAQTQAVTVDTLVWNGPTRNRINLVFLGDGYTIGELDRFSAWCRSAVDSLFQTSKNPTKFYIDHKTVFNAFAIRTASAQSGVSHPAQSIVKKTYFGCGFGGYWTTGYCDQAKIIKTIATYLPEYSSMIMVFNDKGGLRATGGNPILLPEGEYIHVVKHELGHNLGLLGDEYVEEGRTGNCTEWPNVTSATKREAIRWNNWILPVTPLPTPFSNSTVTGLFEGAGFNATGCYRPEADCLMRSYTGYAEGKLVQFCRPCREQMIVSVYLRVHPVDSASPPAGSLTMSFGERKVFRIKAASTPTTAVDWTLDGRPMAVTAPTTMTLSDIAAGEHLLRAVVRDTTSGARRNLSLLADTVLWTVTMQAQTRVKDAGAGIFAGVALSGRFLTLDLVSPARVSVYGLDPLGRALAATLVEGSGSRGISRWSLPRGAVAASLGVWGKGGGAQVRRVIPIPATR